MTQRKEVHETIAASNVRDMIAPIIANIIASKSERFERDGIENGDLTGLVFDGMNLCLQLTEGFRKDLPEHGALRFINELRELVQALSSTQIELANMETASPELMKTLQKASPEQAREILQGLTRAKRQREESEQ